MKNATNLIFALILIIGVFLRFFQLGNLPASLNWDEISHGYNAYSILKTGKDQWGITYPIFNFRAYGDYPTTANLYLTIPFIKTFGLNAFAIRLPHALLGIIFVVFCYLLAQQFFSNTNLSLLVMFLAAISPWAVFPSRGVFQSNLSMTFLAAGLYFFFKSIKKPVFFVFSSILFGFSLYSYHNTRIIVPLLLPLLLLLHYPVLLKNIRQYRFVYIISFFILFITFVPNLFNLLSPESAARNQWVGIINPNSINVINDARVNFSGPNLLNRLFNNKAVYFGKTFTLNYLGFFNPLPLFFEGSQNYQFNPPHTGLFFSVFLPFFYFGLMLLIKKHFRIFLIMIITLLPAALTSGDFPSIRATTALPFYFMAIALGLHYFFQSRFRAFFPLIILAALIQLGIYQHQYFNYNRQYSQTWQYGYQQTIDLVKTLYPQYQQIVFTKKYGEPHEYVLFYWPWDPHSYLADSHKDWNFHSNWYWVDAFDKFKFVNDWEIKDLKPASKTLLVTSPENYPKLGGKLIQTINFLDGSPAFQIVSYE